MYLKSNFVTNSLNRFTYVFDEAAHNKSAHRVLSTATSDTIHPWSSHGRPYRSQSGYFLGQQFKTILKRAKNKHKRHQAQHVILSFSENEFSTKDSSKLNHNADQINELVSGFMKQHFDAKVPWVSGVQADGSGHKLHAHLLISSVDVNGKTIPTNKFTVYTLRSQWNRYLEANYQRVTGRVYHNPYAQPNPEPKVKQPHGWQHDLQQALAAAREQCNSVDDYITTLKQQGITITERNKAGDWSYHVTVNGKRKNVRDFYRRKDKKTGEVKSTRGIGKEYTPSSLQQYFEFKQHNKPTGKDVDANEQTQEETAGPTKSAVPGINRGTAIQRELDKLQQQLQFNPLSDTRGSNTGRSIRWGDNSGPEADR